MSKRNSTTDALAKNRDHPSHPRTNLEVWGSPLECVHAGWCLCSECLFSVFCFLKRTCTCCVCLFVCCFWSMVQPEFGSLWVYSDHPEFWILICLSLVYTVTLLLRTGHLIQRSSGSFLWFWSLCLLTVCVLFVFFVTKMMRQSVMTTLVWLLIIGLKLGLEPITSLWRSRKDLGRLFVHLSGQLLTLTGHWRELWSWLSHDLSGRTKIAPWPTAVHYSNGKTWSRSQAPES